jgi:ClpP class serine protease
LGGSSGVQADERESVSSIRGLNPAVKEMAEDQKMSEQYVKWVESMESLSASIKDSEVDAFLKAEKIGF